MARRYPVATSLPDPGRVLLGGTSAPESKPEPARPAYAGQSNVTLLALMRLAQRTLSMQEAAAMSVPPQLSPIQVPPQPANTDVTDAADRPRRRILRRPAAES